jgi:hypothetical protein
MMRANTPSVFLWVILSLVTALVRRVRAYDLPFPLAPAASPAGDHN